MCPVAVTSRGDFLRGRFRWGSFPTLYRMNFFVRSFRRIFHSCFPSSKSFFRALFRWGFSRAPFRRDLSVRSISGVFPCGYSQGLFPCLLPQKLFRSVGSQWLFRAFCSIGFCSAVFVMIFSLRSFAGAFYERSIPRGPSRRFLAGVFPCALSQGPFCRGFSQELPHNGFFRAVFRWRFFPALLCNGFSVLFFAGALSQSLSGCSILLKLGPCVPSR